jgi:hypothetical protein
MSPGARPRVALRSGLAARSLRGRAAGARSASTKQKASGAPLSQLDANLAGVLLEPKGHPPRASTNGASAFEHPQRFLEPVALVFRWSSRLGAGLLPPKTVDEQHQQLRGRHHRCGEQPIIRTTMDVAPHRTVVVIVPRQIEVEAYKGYAMTWGKPELEVVSEQFDAIPDGSASDALKSTMRSRPSTSATRCGCVGFNALISARNS